MTPPRSYKWNFYKTAVAVSLVFLFVLLVFLFAFGKNESFLIINRHYHPSLDYFFQFVTYLGDGLIYIPLVLYGIFVNKKFLIPIILAIVFCTILSQFSKRVIFPNELRPISLNNEEVAIRTIEGFTVHRRHSFPSGHTSTAFTLALLLATIMRRKFWTIVLPCLAFLVAYSRVYLSQHFVPDVAAGLVIGIISSFFALYFYERYLRKKEKQEQVIQ
jgi:membrane-associated phospholipid phosphatase